MNGIINSIFEDFLCVIPARAGSKGVPFKNRMLINGFPLVQLSVDQAIKAGISPKNIIVSSNDDFVLSYFKQNSFGGVVAHQRPESLCGDCSSTESALIDACKNYPGRKNVVLLQPTSPIRLKGRVQHCLKTYLKCDCDSLLTTTKYYNFFWHTNNNNTWEPSYNITDRPMRQELQITDYRYFDNGNLYITDIKTLITNNSRIGQRPHIYPISEVEAMQIDSSFEANIIKHLIESGINNHIIESEIPSCMNTLNAR